MKGKAMRENPYFHHRNENLELASFSKKKKTKKKKRFDPF